MPWWRKPFTVLVVPHDGSETVSLTIRGLTLFLATFVLSVIVGLGTFFSLYGISNTQTDSSKLLREKIAKLQKQNRQYQKLNRTVQILQKKLHKNTDLQYSILKLNGIKHLARRISEERNVPTLKNVDNTKTKIDKIQKSIQNQINQNNQLESIKRFVKNRNEVLQHTPVLWPVEGWLSSPYGYRQKPMGGQDREFHQGVDLAAWPRSPVRAPAKGTVVQSERKAGYGNTIKIRHEYGYTSLYGHLSERLVEDGTSVVKGQLIGRVGSTGHSTGSHLHYEIRVNGERINPWPYLVQEYESYQSIMDQEALSNAGNGPRSS